MILNLNGSLLYKNKLNNILITKEKRIVKFTGSLNKKERKKLKKEIIIKPRIDENQVKGFCSLNKLLTEGQKINADRRPAI